MDSSEASRILMNAVEHGGKWNQDIAAEVHAVVEWLDERIDALESAQTRAEVGPDTRPAASPTYSVTHTNCICVSEPEHDWTKPHVNIDNLPDVGPWHDIKCPTCGGPARQRATNLRAVAVTGDETAANVETKTRLPMILASSRVMLAEMYSRMADYSAKCEAPDEEDESWKENGGA